ncbi:MAG: ABC transporter permease [Candidatus Rokubacteria bacterium]|nr:ABC transporter permease [Candidatus Rokubacteria bacterium]
MRHRTTMTVKVSRVHAPRRRIAWTGAGWLLLPGLLVLLAFFALPMGTILVYSVGRTAPGALYIPDLTLANYVALVGTPVYFQVMMRTLRLGLIVTLLALVIGYPYAFLMARGRPWVRTGLLLAVLLPLLVSVVVRTYGWIVVLGLDGPVNMLLLALRLTSQPVKFLFNETGIVIGLLHVFFPFMVLPLSSVLQKLDPQLVEAARTLGAGYPTVFWRVILPLSVPGIAAGSMLVFTLSVAAYVTPALMGGAGINVMATLVAQQILVLVNWPLGAAVAVTLVGITLLVVAVYNRFLEASTGVYQRHAG